MRRVFLLLPGFMMACCGGSEGSDNCTDVVCDQPPADECKDAGTLVEYESTGTCDPETGRCEYSFTERHCDDGCAGGRCLEEDRCRGVICNQPPENICKDGSTLLVYEAVGDCNPDTGECVYDGEERSCDNGCENGACKDQDLCQGVVCDSPPANACKDENTLVEYEAEGTCNPNDGRCEYGFTERLCENGCSEGSCRSGQRAAGFVTVLEIQSGWGDRSEVRGYFAEELHLRKAPFYYDADRMTETNREGDCVLYANYRRLLDMCDPPCGMDQYCDGMTCRDYPPHWNVGTINVTGLKTQLSLEPDEYDNYVEMTLPADLFDEGADITVSAAGGELGAFDLSATGVAPLDADSTVDLIAGESTTISWTPGTVDARVQVFLRTGIHRPAPPAAAVFCEVPDSAGQIVIPATLVDAFRNAAGLNQQPCELMRYIQDVKTPFGGEVELRVANVVNLQLNTP